MVEVDIKRDDTGNHLWVEAWQTGGQSNMYLLAGKGFTLPQLQQMFSGVTAGQPGQAAHTDILMVIPAGAKVERGLPDDITAVTVYTDAAIAAGSPQAATLRFFDIR
jgi:hypothetical protein